MKSEFGFYLDYIGIFVNENEELAAVSKVNYDSTFDNNFVNCFNSIKKIKKKFLKNQ